MINNKALLVTYLDLNILLKIDKKISDLNIKITFSKAHTHPFLLHKEVGDNTFL